MLTVEHVRSCGESALLASEVIARCWCDQRESFLLSLIRVCVWRVRRRVLSDVLGSNSEPFVN